MSGKEEYNLWINIVCMPIFLLVTYFFVSNFEVIGGAYSQVASYSILAAMYLSAFFILFKNKRV
jgi:hypothetical protein